nr:Beta helix incomplete domain containing protein [Pandoravirus belohorizontensis]
MSVRFGALTETQPDGGVLRVLRLDAGAGRWTSPETPITPGAAQEFVLTVAAETTTVEIVVALFDQRVQGLFDGVVPFVSDPALAKTSLRIADWPWAAADSRIELDLTLDPPFANFTRIDDAPTATTTYTLNGSTSGVGRATVRLSTAALVDGRLLAGAVSSRADVGASSIVISLPRFESALVYDPDMGVLFGSSSGGDGGDGDSGGGGPGTHRAGKASDSSMDQTATVIAATASIGAAAVLVAAIIAGVVALQAYRQERLASTVAREVAFDPEVASGTVL